MLTELTQTVEEQSIFSRCSCKLTGKEQSLAKKFSLKIG